MPYKTVQYYKPCEMFIASYKDVTIFRTYGEDHDYEEPSDYYFSPVNDAEDEEEHDRLAFDVRDLPGYVEVKNETAAKRRDRIRALMHKAIDAGVLGKGGLILEGPTYSERMWAENKARRQAHSLDAGGTGHGDISMSDADPGL